MNFDFEPIPLVETKKKHSTFKIIPIGGPDEIKKWREMQDARESAYRMRLGDRDTRIAKFEADTGQTLDQPKVSSAKWEEKLSFAMSERKRLAQVEKRVTDFPQWEPKEAPTPKFTQRIANFFKRIWNNANF